MKGWSRMSIERLQQQIRAKKNPTMVSLDPVASRLPAHLLEEATGKHGETLSALAHAYETFSFGILDALRDLVPAVKVQAGCFQALGRDGAAALETVLARARELGYYVLLDTAASPTPVTGEALAQACFGGIPVGAQRFTPLACDGLSLQPYQGSDSVKPLLPYLSEDKSLFLVARSANKSAREMQDLLSGDRVVHQVVIDLAMRWCGERYGKSGYAGIGVVLSGTQPDFLKRLRKKYDRLFFLVPGYGSWGAYGKDVQHAFDLAGHGAVVCAGRTLLYAYEKSGGDGRDYQETARKAAEKMRDNILQYIEVL